MSQLTPYQAIQAFLDKQEVEYSSEWDASWNTLTLDSPMGLLNAPNIKFRLKPKLVTLTYATPLPFTPKDGEEYWCIEPRADNGYLSSYYRSNTLHNLRVMLGVYRTEVEVRVALANQQGAIANIL